MPSSVPSLYEDLPDWEVEACARAVFYNKPDPALYVVDVVDDLQRKGYARAAESWRRIGIALGGHIRAI